MLKIAIVEDEDTLRSSMESILRLSCGYETIYSYSNAESFLSDLNLGVKPDIILLDILLPGMSGIEAIPQIKEMLPNSYIVMSSVLEDSDSIYESLRAGSVGYITKDMFLGDIKDTISIIANGGSIMSPRIARKVVTFFQKNKSSIDEKLSEREQEVVNLITQGYSYKMIAEKCDISINTVREYIKRIYTKLQINSRGQLFALYKTHKLF